MTDITIEEYKIRLAEEFDFSEQYDKEAHLNKSFSTGTILLTPMESNNHRRWVNKAIFEWNRGGRTIVLVTQLRPDCKYYKKNVAAHAEIRLINECIIYNNKKNITKQYIVAIFKAQPSRQLNYLVEFN